MGNGQFTALIKSSGFLGIFKTDLSILANSKIFQLGATSSLDFKTAIENIGKSIKAGISSAFKAALKIEYYINMAKNYVHKGIDQLCSLLQLDKIKISLPGVTISVCDGLKRFASAVAEGINKILKPAIDLMGTLLEKAVGAVFSALGTLLDIQGQSKFKSP